MTLLRVLPLDALNTTAASTTAAKKVPCEQWESQINEKLGANVLLKRKKKLPRDALFHDVAKDLDATSTLCLDLSPLTNNCCRNAGAHSSLPIRPTSPCNNR